MDTGKLDDDELDRLMAGVRELAARPIHLDDRFGARLERLIVSARRLHRQGSLGLMVVDYVQLLRSERRYDSRQIELSAITRSLKRLAMELQIPLLLLAQLSREAVRAGGDADVHHIKATGSVEEDSDVVVIINLEEETGRAFLDVRKNRHGPMARLLVTREMAVSLFSDQNIAAPLSVIEAFEGGDA